MYKTTVVVHGMACGMCEAHINDVVRKTYPKAKKVSSSAKKKQTTFLTEESVDIKPLETAINATGYEYISSETKEYVKKGLFSK